MKSLQKQALEKELTELEKQQLVYEQLADQLSWQQNKDKPKVLKRIKEIQKLLAEEKLLPGSQFKLNF